VTAETIAVIDLTLKGNFKMVKTKQTKLAEALKAGKEFTSKQIASRFGLANPTAAVNNVRVRNGLRVNTVTRTNSKGKTSTVYTMKRA
jgi:hypothetical protein